MKIKLSTLENIPEIMTIIKDAKELLASLKIDQWQNGYPNAAQVEQDILKGESYVVLSDENQVIATSMFTTNKEPTYQIIEEGSWKVDESKNYGVIHRMAIKKEYRKQGLATLLFDEFHQQLKSKNIQSLKIDTHEENLGMQALIKKIGYQYCGIIYTNYGAKRLAFEKVIQ
ncbi:MAG: GNAT family N-acetyltransferase [Polaribacter sp.]|jgi:ribosomal protein S18 acetylase RimI-like enzyme|nr:GNAT family N-acetyltransferase [Polaribacter sp.]MBT4779636.1 GNAT family N-acetyltransferase [Polaribacter sp.]MBT5099273.1 GNAT family N-acetyltransferase [Polaribacter sp.]MBT5644824.1 GNAT family N-acetyltransferase [Polaribacter sp.]MDA9092737.1 GNAT family N-acetyltransferase [Polaribacter sp.]MDA9968640.1 GNAT family N-acetyltransferase [Polaribacter sp.]